MTNKTFLPTSNSYSQRKWYIIDCKDKTLGRTCSAITKILQGKHKPFYHPAADLGDNIILINATDLTLNDTKKRAYVFQPGRPGSSLSYKTVCEDRPERIIENCVKNMMGEGMAKRNITKRLKVYLTQDHPHVAQKPIEYNI